MKKDSVLENGVLEHHRISILVDYIEGNISENQEVAVRKKLQQNKALRADYYFLANYLTNINQEAPCPSSELIAEYSSGGADISPELKKYIDGHVNRCKRCSEALEELEHFNEEAKEIEQKVLSDFGAEKQISFRDILKRVGRKYIDETLLEAIFTQLPRLEQESRQGLELAPVRGLGFSDDAEVSSQEKEFLEILNSLYPLNEELEAMIQEGRKKALKERLSEELEDEEKVEEVLKEIGEAR